MQIVTPNTNPIASTFSVATAVVSAALDGSGDSLAFLIGHLDAGKTIESISLYVSSVTGTPPAYTVRLETVNAGTPPVPSGTLVAAGSSGSVTPSAAGIVTATLSTPLAPTSGQLYAIVINSASASGTDYATFRATAAYMSALFLPCALVNTTGSYAAQTGGPCVRVNYSDGTFGHTMLAINTGVVTVSTSTSPDEVGNVLIPNVPTNIRGIGAAVRLQSTAADAELILYDSVDTELATITLLGDTNVNDNSNQYKINISDGVSELLTVGATYRLAFKPTTTNDCRAGQIQFANTTDRKIWLGMQDHTNDVPLFNCYKTSRADAGSWTDDETYVAAIWPIVRSYDIAGGGLLIHPGLNGGLNG